jgi:hypothetical protein
VLPHETVHWGHQRSWCLYGLGVGLLIWFLLYLLVLPLVWNPLRRYTEREAYRVDGLTDAEIDTILRRWPYLLWL